MTTVEVLEKARARVAKGWCQAVYARDVGGEATQALHPDARQWCMRGAFLADPELDIELYNHALDVLEPFTGAGVSHWNDAPGRTQAEVLAAFDKAIQLARSAG